MKNHNQTKFNIGFSLVELIVVISILIIVALGVSSFHTFMVKREIKAKEEINAKTAINLIKNMMISDYKFHRGDNPVSAAPVDNGSARFAIQPNILPIVLQNTNDNNILKTETVNNIPIGEHHVKEANGLWNFIPLRLAFPLTPEKLADNRDKFNTKFFVIRQLINSNNNRIPRVIYYTMSCQPLPQNIKQLFKRRETNLAKLLNDANFYNNTKCIQENGIYTSSMNENGYAIDNNTCITSDNNTVVLQRDTWDNGTFISSQTFPTPQSIGTDNNILGITFCMWLPSEEDILTADTTEIELYYYILNKMNNKEKEFILTVKKEKLSLHRDTSISTGVFPIKEH